MSFGKSVAAAVVSAAAMVFIAPVSMGAVDVVELTAQEISVGLAGGTFTSAEVVQGYLERIGQYEPYYNAFTYINPNALADAAALDAEYLLTGPRSPMHGVPVVIKDSMNVAGVRTTAGFAGFASEAMYNGLPGLDLIPEQDSPIVARLRAAGAIILGKTNLPVFARSGSHANNSYDGPTFNSFDRDLIPGGSSSGSSTATSASFTTLGMAEETGGSIQHPAGAQMLVGVKTSFGLVPTSGGVPLSGSTRDVFGPVAKSVFDAAIALDVIAGPDPSDPKTAAAIIPAGGYVAGLTDTALVGKRIGLWGPGFKDRTLTAETQVLYDAAVEVLKAQGATVVANPFEGTTFSSLTSFPASGNSLPYDIDQWFASLGASAAATSAADYKAKTGIDLFAAAGPLTNTISESLAAALEDPSVLPDISGFFTGREALLAKYREVMDTFDLDAFFFPQMWDELPGRTAGNYRATTVSEINLLGVPGVNLAGGFYASGSPFSVQFMGDMWSEGLLLSLAYDFEQATMHRIAPTLVPEPAGAGLLIGGLLLLRRKRRAA